MVARDCKVVIFVRPGTIDANAEWVGNGLGLLPPVVALLRRDQRLLPVMVAAVELDRRMIR
jgi:hypothetical protein